MSPTVAKRKPPGREFPERTRWVGKRVTPDDINAELDRLHRAAGGSGRVLALARTLNLIVVPCSDRSEKGVERRLQVLGSHTPSRTLVLREHGEDRVDADVLMECEFANVAGHVGLCHDRVLLTLDPARLEHSASLVASLVIPDLPTVLWLPESRSPIPDSGLLERAQHLLIDSSADGHNELPRIASLAQSIRVHDLAWGRLEFWRAATAAAFEPIDRRRLLSELTEVNVHYEQSGLQAALLLAGWIAARLGWRVTPMKSDGDGVQAAATRGDGGEVSINLLKASRPHGCGGVEALTLKADCEDVAVTRSGATSSLRDMFAEALQPLASFARGYAPAVTAAAVMAEGSS